jgi:transcriptional regulator with XRE-family HTH domain
MPNRLSTYTVKWGGEQYAVRHGLIALAIQGYREQAGGLSDEELCQHLGIKRTTLWRVLTGHRVGPQTVLRLTEALGLDLSEVLQPSAPKPQLEELAGKFPDEGPPPSHQPRNLGLSLLAALALGLSALADARPHLWETTFGFAVPFFVVAVLFVPRRYLIALTALALLLRGLAAAHGGIPWPQAVEQDAETLALALALPYLKRREERQRSRELSEVLTGVSGLP